MQTDSVERIQPRSLRKLRAPETPNWLQVPVEWWGKPVSEFPAWQFRNTDKSEYAEVMTLLDRWRNLAVCRGREVRRLNNALKVLNLITRDNIRSSGKKEGVMFRWKPFEAAMTYAEMQHRLAELDNENRNLRNQIKELS